MMNQSVSPKFHRWLEVFWLSALAAYVVAGAALVPFHGDESTQIFMGRDYFYLFRDGDLSKVLYDRTWTHRPDEQHLRLINGTVSKTIHGWLAASAGMKRDEINGQWDWKLDYAGNLESDHIPDTQLLHRARLASAGQLALSAALFYVLVRMTIGKPVAIVASALYALHPAILINGRRAMMEGAHLLGMILVLLMAAWLLQERRWWKLVLLGVISGVSVAAKHPNGFVVAIVFFACGALWLREAFSAQGQTRQRLMQALVGLLSAGALALIVFYLMNPAWWEAPFESAAEVLRLRVELLTEQVELYGGFESPVERVEGLFDYAFVQHSQYYEVVQWAGYEEIRAQISAYESSRLAGLAIGGGKLGGLVMLGLTIWGIVYLVRARHIDRKVRWLLLAWGGGIAIITLLVTPLPWQRYYLPVLPFVQIAAACALVHLFTPVWNRVASRIHSFSLTG